jgi:hypothetical protein
MAKKKETGVLDYLWEAFKFRWNVLVLGGATAAAVLSGKPDIALPLVAAGEMAYLAGMTAIPKFREAIDAKKWNENRGEVQEEKATKVKKSFGELLKGLKPERRNRFQRLRARCLDMNRIAEGVRGKASGGDGARAHSTPALDRLLWVFIRLLFSQQALARFLDTTEEGDIKTTITGLEKRLAEAKEKNDERIVRSLTDSLATAQLRAENYSKAESNAEFVDIELDRIEQKIQALTEMAVSTEDPDYISSQVDSVADSMVATEKAIRDLNYITGFDDAHDAPPPILEADLNDVMEIEA